MYIQQLYSGILNEATYYIESEGEAAVIDPLKDAEDYLSLAKERKVIIKYIFKTNFHRDFASSQLDLFKKTGVPVIFGPLTKTTIPAYIATDGEIFKVGKISLQALHTPGHTIESTCYLLKDETNKNHALFTGDTFAVSDAGRLYFSCGDINQEALAGIMYNTIQKKILPLEDDVLVYPAHGPGSNGGKNLAPVIYGTIGDLKQNNYALQPQAKNDFIEAVSNNLADAPDDSSVNAQSNMEGYGSLDLIKQKALVPLTIAAFKTKMQGDITVLDTRQADIFTGGFIPGSIFIGLEGRFAEWAGSILSFTKPMILITGPGKEEDTVTRLARVGFSKIEGYLQGSFEAWKGAGEKVDMIIDVEADELAMDIPHDLNLQVVDVRRETEFADGHVKNANNIPLNDMTDVALIAGFEETQNLYVHCGGGYRSVIACSLMKSHGLHNLRNVAGGWEKIKEEKTIKTVKEPSLLN